MILNAIVLAIAIVSPKEGAVVPLLRESQKTYLAGASAERHARMNNRADRAKLFQTGARQQPVKIEWTGAGDVVTVFVDREKFTVTNRTEVYVTNLELGREYRLTVLDGKGGVASGSFRTEDVPPRFLRAGGVANFRDLGGWKTADGGRVRQGLILRSAGLRSSSKAEGGLFRQKVILGQRRVTDEGIATLKREFGVRTDLELRTPQEVAGMGGTLLGPEAKWKHVSFAAYEFVDNMIRGREPFAKIFRVFTDERNYPVLMHCSGGRDRTGTLAFLLNGLLGVSEDDLLRDWEASVFSDDGMGFNSERVKGFLAYLQAYPGDDMKTKVEGYVKSCGISDEEIAAFRKIMLESKEQ